MLFGGGPNKFSFFRPEKPEGSGISYGTEMFVEPSQSQQQLPLEAGDGTANDASTPPR